ncbi:MAG: ATP-binding protein [Propioniciclava sp.]|uniref:ATP-binding protein n=1 Tax=Propioniciclava sp. TaxID=2038686 RepID=UPI0039E4B22C
MSINPVRWQDIGFDGSPYYVHPISPDPDGNGMFVGRDAELARLKSQLRNTTLHPCIEGESGVGKTSLVAVAGYQLQKEFVRGVEVAPFALVRNPFQLTPETTSREFTSSVIRELAHAFNDHRHRIDSQRNPFPSVGELEAWVSRPVQSDDFQSVVRSWLSRAFPSNLGGGFICVLDNLELVRTSARARQVLEEMRDDALALPGVRWVLCGAKGVVEHGTSSSRLEGRLATPMKLRPLGMEKMPLLINRRISVFRRSTDAIAPVQEEGFSFLYKRLGHNLRAALNYAENFSVEMLVRNQVFADREKMFKLLKVWVGGQAREKIDVLSGHVSEGHWAILREAKRLEPERIYANMYLSFGFATAAKFRQYLRDLEAAALVTRASHEGDQRYNAYTITPKGALCLHELPGGAALD